MKMWRVILVITGLASGIILGLAYGWLIDPVKFVDTNPSSLRIDYQTDVVVMVATIYTHELDTQAAIDRLSLLGTSNIGGLLEDSLNYAKEMHFTSQDIEYVIILNEAITNTNGEGGDQQ